MSHTLAMLATLACLMLGGVPCSACIWDSDTLAAERARFPEIAELITGSFARHSREFHEWRRQRCEAMIKSPTALAETYDDLAVSQHKLGDQKAAIATMQQKEKLFPGKYETCSNLGTFYIYTGELNQALLFIRKALAINPDAHFGREKYQLSLVEWLQEKTRAKEEDPAGISLAFGVPRGFAAYLVRRQMGLRKGEKAPSLQMPPIEQASAVRGLTGMMWFADFDNPVLLEALGDVLVAGDIKQNAAQLAALCYLHAAEKAPDGLEADRLRELARQAGDATQGFDVATMAELLKRGLNHGRAFIAAVWKDEAGWIQRGEDAEKEFRQKYLKR